MLLLPSPNLNQWNLVLRILYLAMLNMKTFDLYLTLIIVYTLIRDHFFFCSSCFWHAMCVFGEGTPGADNFFDHEGHILSENVFKLLSWIEITLPAFSSKRFHIKMLLINDRYFTRCQMKKKETLWLKRVHGTNPLFYPTCFLSPVPPGPSVVYTQQFLLRIKPGGDSQ